MKRKYLTIFIILMMALATQSEASIVYNFDVTLDYTGLTPAQKIQGIEFVISGIQNVDWVFGAFNSPYAAGTWLFSSTGIIDDTWNGSDMATSVPLNSGSIFSLVSPNDSVISISGMTPFNYQNNDFPGNRFTAQLNNAVPIPAAVWLLGSGLVGLIGLRRRMRK